MDHQHLLKSDNAVPYLGYKISFISLVSVSLGTEKVFPPKRLQNHAFLLNITFFFPADFECGPPRGRGGEYQNSG